MKVFDHVKFRDLFVKVQFVNFYFTCSIDENKEEDLEKLVTPSKEALKPSPPPYPKPTGVSPRPAAVSTRPVGVSARRTRSSSTTDTTTSYSDDSDSDTSYTTTTTETDDSSTYSSHSSLG